MGDPTDPVPTGAAETVRCLHCKKSVVARTDCLKCGGTFHPACMAQANEAKNKQCKHMDGKSLIKEVEMQNKLIQKMTTKIALMEENYRKLSEKFERFNDNRASAGNSDNILEKVQALETAMAGLRTDESTVLEHNTVPQSQGEVRTSNMRLSADEDLLSMVDKELKSQSLEISRKLDGIVGAIKDSNKELVRFLIETTKVQEISAKDSASGLRSSSGRVEPLSATKKGVVRGTSDAVTVISAAAERRWIYVRNLSSDCNTDQVSNHLSNNNIPVMSCERLGDGNNNNSTSFKISVDPGLVDVILRSEMWPTNVIVKPFIFRKGRSVDVEQQQNFRTGYRYRERPHRRSYM